MRRETVLTILLSSLLLVLCLAAGCRSAEKEGNGIIKEDFTIEAADGAYIRGQVVIPENYSREKLPLVTLGHGFRGNMNSAGGEALAESLADAGIAAVRMDYSHYREAKGDRQTNQYTVNTMVDDQLRCIRYAIDRYNIDEKRIGLYGRSLGGRAAMIMANENKGGYDYSCMVLAAPAGNDKALPYYMGGEDSWKRMKAKAQKEGGIVHQGVVLTPEFFTSVEDYTPSRNGGSYRNPVLVIYNTEDYVVLPETCAECAAAYVNVEVLKVTSEKGGHGLEMSWKESKLKDRLLQKITDFFTEYLLNLNHT